MRGGDAANLVEAVAAGGGTAEAPGGVGAESAPPGEPTLQAAAPAGHCSQDTDDEDECKESEAQEEDEEEEAPARIQSELDRESELLMDDMFPTSSPTSPSD